MDDARTNPTNTTFYGFNFPPQIKEKYLMHPDNGTDLFAGLRCV